MSPAETLETEQNVVNNRIVSLLNNLFIQVCLLFSFRIRILIIDYNFCFFFFRVHALPQVAHLTVV